MNLPTRRAHRRLVAITIALLGFGASAYAQPAEAYRVEAGVMLWRATPDIVITSGALGTPVDFVNTFAVEKKRLTDFRITVKPGIKHKFRFSTSPIKYEATQTLTQTIRFSGQTYSIGVPTTATLNWTLIRGGYEYDAVVTQRGFVGVLLDLKYNKLKAELSAPLVALQTYQRNVPVPTIGGIWRGYLTPNSSITAEFSGFKWDHNGVTAKLTDFDIYGTGNAGKVVGVQFGYRSLSADYDSETDVGDLKLKGPYFAFLIRF